MKQWIDGHDDGGRIRRQSVISTDMILNQFEYNGTLDNSVLIEMA